MAASGDEASAELHDPGSPGGRERHAASGDVALNFRYQLAGDGGDGITLAPRASLLLPTGDERKGRGAGGLGFQGNLPFSIRPLPRLALHANAGLTWMPSAKNALGQTAATLNANLGGSAIWLLARASTSWSSCSG